MPSPLLIEDADGAPLPAELQPNHPSGLFAAIRGATAVGSRSAYHNQLAAEAVARALAPLLWPLLPSNDRNAALEAIRRVPRRSNTPEWAVGLSYAQAIGYDAGLATAADAVRSALREF